MNISHVPTLVSSPVYHASRPWGKLFYHEKNIALPIPEQDDPITFESLSYVKCFCSLKEEDEKPRCSRGCSDKIHEISIL